MSPSQSKQKKHPYQSYLEEKHAKFNTPSNVIDEIVFAAVGSLPKDRKKIILGEVNEVYDLITKDDQQFIVRISRSDNPRFETEKWAIDEVRKMGVPAPEVLLVRKETVGDDHLTICVERKLPGMPLRDIPYPERDRIRNIVQQAGGILAKIHSVNPQGFGGFEKPGVGKYASWVDYVMEVDGDRDAIAASAVKIGLTAEDVDQGFNILRQNTQLFENVSPHLLHSDFSSKHILVEGNTVTGILDFEGSRSGDPVWDFAWWDHFFGTDLPVDWLKHGYEKLFKLGLDFDKKLALYKLRLGLMFIHYYESEGNVSGMQDTREKYLVDLKSR